MAPLRPLAPAHARRASGGSMQLGAQPGPVQPHTWDFSHLPMPQMRFVDMTDRTNKDGTFRCHEMVVCIDEEHFFICSLFRYMGPFFNPCSISLLQVDMRPRTAHQIPPDFTKFMMAFMRISMHEVESSPIIPVEHYCPLYTPNLRVAPPWIRQYAYMKRVSLCGYLTIGDKTVLAKSVADEAAIGEVLFANPHPNLAKYWGCVIHDGRIIGLVYGRYNFTLHDRVESKVPLNTVKCIEDIKAGLAHLHSLGYAHNDLSPSNIMMNTNDNAVIIDFDSCTVEGGPLSKLGTPGWAKPPEEMTVGSRENDFYSLGKIEDWLRREAVLPIVPLGLND